MSNPGTSEAILQWGLDMPSLMPLSIDAQTIIPVALDEPVKRLADIVCLQELDEFAVAVKSSGGWMLVSVEAGERDPLVEPFLMDVNNQTIRMFLGAALKGETVQFCESEVHHHGSVESHAYKGEVVG